MTKSGSCILINDYDVPVSGTVANGLARVQGDTLTSAVSMEAKNGSGELDAGSVNNASLTASNGKVDVSVGTIAEKLYAKVDNGDLDCELKKQPQNLKFILNAKYPFFNNVDLPHGWRDGYTIGDGKPVLELSVGNGELELEVD